MQCLASLGHRSCSLSSRCGASAFTASVASTRRECWPLDSAGKSPAAIAAWTRSRLTASTRAHSRSDHSCSAETRTFGSSATIGLGFLPRLRGSVEFKSCIACRKKEKGAGQARALACSRRRACWSAGVALVTMSARISSQHALSVSADAPAAVSLDSLRNVFAILTASSRKAERAESMSSASAIDVVGWVKKRKRGGGANQ